ncbi:carbohydrate sulfotransferase 1-like [Haemaphysalis longicornis]
MIGKPAANGVKRTNKTGVLPKIPKRYAVVNPAKKNRILLLAYFRSGSSFLGQLLSSAINETFFSYEPLDLLSAGERLNASTVRAGLDILRNHLTCQFSRMSDYLAMGAKRWNHYAVNTFLMDLCDREVNVCLNPKFMTAVCRRSLVHIVKVTRLSVAQLLAWVRQNAAIRNGSLKVVHLVRDPRAMVVSRKAMHWCRVTPKCGSPEHFCREMSEDLDAFEQLKSLLPIGAAIRLRYEDIAARPQNESKALFRALGLEFSGAVVDFLKEHTTGADPEVLRNPYSIVRRSDVAALAWTRKLSWERIKEVQTTCAAVLQRLGYKIFHDKKELSSVLP